MTSVINFLSHNMSNQRHKTKTHQTVNYSWRNQTHFWLACRGGGGGGSFPLFIWRNNSGQSVDVWGGDVAPSHSDMNSRRRHLSVLLLWWTFDNDPASVNCLRLFLSFPFIWISMIQMIDILRQCAHRVKLNPTKSNLIQLNSTILAGFKSYSITILTRWKSSSPIRASW